MATFCFYDGTAEKKIFRRLWSIQNRHYYGEFKSTNNSRLKRKISDTKADAYANEASKDDNKLRTLATNWNFGLFPAFFDDEHSQLIRQIYIET